MAAKPSYRALDTGAARSAASDGGSYNGCVCPHLPLSSSRIILISIAFTHNMRNQVQTVRVQKGVRKVDNE